MKLLSKNTPEKFWHCQIKFREEYWIDAIAAAIHILGMNLIKSNIDELLNLVLGEGQFGHEHWNLSSSKRLYYIFKPFLPRPLTRFLRRSYDFRMQKYFPLNWPIERRYVEFLWQVIKNLLTLTKKEAAPFLHFWPKGYRYAFVLTHDIETKEGQDHVRAVADLEESFGFRSSFNFVPERYVLNRDLMSELFDRGFEIGLHGLKHDGKLFNSRDQFVRRADRINHYLKQFNAVGFRAPLTHRHPEWMQSLEIEYDLSFFDTDPFEPISGGTMSLWPFQLGHFIELPYTLVQDYTLIKILGETTPKIWLDKVKFIKQYYGMVLLNTHPDYLKNTINWRVYSEFLEAMSAQRGCWNGLPREVANWWRKRFDAICIEDLPGGIQGRIRLIDENLIIE